MSGYLAALERVVRGGTGIAEPRRRSLFEEAPALDDGFGDVEDEIDAAVPPPRPSHLSDWAPTVLEPTRNSSPAAASVPSEPAQASSARPEAVPPMQRVEEVAEREDSAVAASPAVEAVPARPLTPAAVGTASPQPAVQAEARPALSVEHHHHYLPTSAPQQPAAPVSDPVPLPPGEPAQRAEAVPVAPRTVEPLATHDDEVVLPSEAASAAPLVIEIGRIEVRIESPSPVAPRPEPRRPMPAAPSLADFLAGGGR